MSIAAIIIGRNEGERLRRCLASVAGKVDQVIYVDSGSTDDSVAIARQAGGEVVPLESGRPFTAARARNAGLARLNERVPDTPLVQFIDGDCEMSPGWFEAAARALAEDPEVALVCGRLHERNREASIYNRLCDMEWDQPIGDITECGGIFIARTQAINDVGAFDELMLAGEEPELCVRLRQAGHRLRRIDAPMARHDADMHRFGQWWRRAVRAGYGFAHGARLQGRTPQRHWVRPVRSNWFWGMVLPLLIAASVWPSAGWSLLLLGLYPAQAVRIYMSQRRAGRSPSDARLFACFCVLGKVPAALGQLKFHLTRAGRGGETGPAPAPAAR